MRPPAARRRRSPRLPATRGGAAGLAAIAFLGVAACAPPPAPPEPPPLILLVSLDAFRADLLDERRADGSPQTPHLEAFARASHRFDAAFAPIAFTLPSHMTLLTGLPPEAHGVTREGASLGAGIPTLASWLGEHGYATSAIVNATWMRADFGLNRGFESYEMVRGLAGSARQVTDLALATVTAARAATPARPLFLFLHYFEAHSDFPSQGTRLSYFSPPEYRSDLALTEADVCDARGRCGTELLSAADADGRELPAAAVELHRELYRRGARFLDAELGRLFEGLRAARVWDDAWIVITADHGEEFREHGRFLHTQAYRECLQVPLLMRFGAAGEGRRDGRLVGLEDVFPTLAARFGGDAPEPWGFDLLDARGPARERPALLGRERNAERLYALRTRDRLLFRDLDSGARRLYLLDRDPRELRERAGDEPDEVRRLERLLAAELQRARAAAVEPETGPDARFDERERAELRSLGYL